MQDRSAEGRPLARARRRSAWTSAGPLAVVAILALVVAFSAAPALAASSADLRQRIEARYEVEAVPAGISLELLEPRFGVRSITVEGDRITVNQATVPRQVLLDWLGDDARLVLELAELSASEQRRLFGLAAAAETGAEAAATAEAPAASGEDTDEPDSEVPLEDPQAEGAAETDVEVESTGRAPDARRSISPVPRAPRPPRPPRPMAREWIGSKIAFFGDVLVKADEEAEEAVALFGSVTVDGEVERDVVAIFGSVWVNGKVGREVTAVRGSVYIGPDGHVGRAVTAVGGRVEVEPGARVEEVIEVPLWGVPQWGTERHPGHFTLGGMLWASFWRAVILALIILVAGVTALLAPQVVEQVTARTRLEWWKAGLTGFVALLLFGPLTALAVVLLMVTCIGIPLIPVLLLALAIAVPLACLVGYVGVARCLGEVLGRRLGWSLSSTSAVAFGVLVIELPRLLGTVIEAAGWLFAVGGGLLAAVGLLIRWAVILIGVGALLLNRYSRRAGGEAGGAYLPPPPPPPPTDPTAAGAAAAMRVMDSSADLPVAPSPPLPDDEPGLEDEAPPEGGPPPENDRP